VSSSNVTTHGIEGARPDRDATVGVNAGRPKRRRRGGEQPVVPDAEFASYYGRPIIKHPSWKAPDIPAYLFCGGLAGGASVLGAAAQATGRPTLARASKVGAVCALGTGLVGLVHDLGRPARFANMLRTFKPTSPMSMGSWLLAGYGPAAGVAAATSITGWFPRAGRVSTTSAAVMGPFVAAYTGALLSDTAVPAWHDGYRELPFVFAGSGLLAAVLATAVEVVAGRRMEQRLGVVAEPYTTGRSGALMRVSDAIAIGGSVGALVFARRRVASAVCGLALITASAMTKLAVFEAGFRSADDPRYTVDPQRASSAARAATSLSRRPSDAERLSAG
jgi:DMSO reductase anchor subunit